MNENSTHYGMSWDMVRDIVASPKPLQNLALRMACLLIEYPNLRASTSVVAGKIKSDVFKIEECATYNPRLFSIEHGSKFIRLLATGENPAAETPAQKAERERQDIKKHREMAKAMAEQAEYDQDTPFNAIWKRIETLGLDRKAAKGLAKRLTSSYPENIIFHGLAAAEKTKPTSPAGYIISTIHRILQTEGSGQSKTSFAKKPQKILSRTKRGESRTTTLIGWESSLHNNIRHKLFRLPEGSIKREAPKTGEHVPSLEDDPGYEII